MRSPVRRFSISRKTALITTAVIVVVGIAVAALVIVRYLNAEPSTNTSGQVEQPDFDVLLPAHKTTEDVDGKLVHTPKNEPVFTYKDGLNAVAITVNEQPLSDAFKANKDSMLAEVAKGFNATRTLSAGDTKVYIGISAKGPQSLLFVKDDLLFLIQSEKKIPDDAWITYINQLK